MAFGKDSTGSAASAASAASPTSPASPAAGGIAATTQLRKERNLVLAAAFKLAKEKSLEKALNQLIDAKVLTHDAKVIADFVHANLAFFDLETVGEYLGGTRPKEEKPFENEVRLDWLIMSK